MVLRVDALQLHRSWPASTSPTSDGSKSREPVPRPWSKAQRPETAATPTFYVPSVLLPPDAAKSPSVVHKIHILGDDERSRFIAHALSGVYDSVEMLGWKKNSASPATFSSKYRNIYKTRLGDQRRMKLEHVSVTPRVINTTRDDDNSHIDELLVAGPGHKAVEALRSVKHRINKDTTVCLMTDGLGVLEEVRARVFAGIGESSRPSFLLGHMSHRLAFNRRHDAVRELRHGKTQLTRVDDASEITESRLHFVQALQAVQDLNSSLTPFDQWLRFKLPSVMLDSVVEPVCVLLDMSYAGLLQNPSAQRMMHRLLAEIVSVVDSMPEVEGSAAIRRFIRGNRLRQHIYGRIMARRGASSGELAKQIQKGQPTDIDYLNGFFIRRGQQLGLDLPTNLLMRDMVKAKHSLAIERLNSYIPIEETSIPSHLAFRYRTTV
ncbi:ketopantoate reductase PanE/ApbA C terminal domain-containing protein [Trichoderma austrokoningii]